MFTITYMFTFEKVGIRSPVRKTYNVKNGEEAETQAQKYIISERRYGWECLEYHVEEIRQESGGEVF